LHLVKRGATIEGRGGVYARGGGGGEQCGGKRGEVRVKEIDRERERERERRYRKKEKEIER